MCPYFYYLMFSENFYRSPQPFFPPSGPPSSGPGGQGGGHVGPPKGPPPSKIPAKSEVSLKAIDSGSIRFCKYKYTYIWLDNRQSFWAWITFVGRRSISGWRWTGRRWTYFGIDTRRIESFVCY